MVLNNRRPCQWGEAKKLAAVTGVPASVWMDGPGERIIKHIDQAAKEGKGMLAGPEEQPPGRPFFVPNPDGEGEDQRANR